MASTSPEKLLEQLARGKAIGALLLLGTDHYLREMCRNRIIETCVPEAARDWAVARLSARDAGWDEILQRAETLPMLAPRQVIVVEDVESVEKLGEKSRDEIIEALEKYLSSPAPFTILVLEASELDGRQIMDHFAEIVKSGQTSVLVVTHDPEMAARCNRVCSISDGILYEQ